MNLFCYYARLAQWQSSRFVSGRLWVQVPHLAPPFRFTPGRHGSQRRSSLGYAEGHLSVKSVGEINSLDALFWSNPQMLKQWQSSGTLPQNYSVCTFGQVTVHLAGFKAVFTAVLTRSTRHETDRWNFQLASKHLSNWWQDGKVLRAAASGKQR